MEQPVARSLSQRFGLDASCTRLFTHGVHVLLCSFCSHSSWRIDARRDVLLMAHVLAGARGHLADMHLTSPTRRHAAIIEGLPALRAPEHHDAVCARTSFYSRRRMSAYVFVFTTPYEPVPSCVRRGMGRYVCLYELPNITTPYAPVRVFIHDAV